MPLKPSSLAWARLNSVPVIRAARATVTRAFVAHQVGHRGRLHSLDDLTPERLAWLNENLARHSNGHLERAFIDYLKDRSTGRT